MVGSDTEAALSVRGGRWMDEGRGNSSMVDTERVKREAMHTAEVEERRRASGLELSTKSTLEYVVSRSRLYSKEGSTVYGIPGLG